MLWCIEVVLFMLPVYPPTSLTFPTIALQHRPHQTKYLYLSIEMKNAIRNHSINVYSKWRLSCINIPVLWVEVMFWYFVFVYCILVNSILWAFVLFIFYTETHSALHSINYIYERIYLLVLILNLHRIEMKCISIELQNTYFRFSDGNQISVDFVFCRMLHYGFFGCGCIPLVIYWWCLWDQMILVGQSSSDFRH